MTDQEFDVLDELYFVVSFEQLKTELEMEDADIKKVLQQLLAKEWIKCYASTSEELLPHEVDMERNFQKYFYLATKAGLLAHNGR